MEPARERSFDPTISRLVDLIATELTSFGQFNDEWENIDTEVQDEIKRTWHDIILLGIRNGVDETKCERSAQITRQLIALQLDPTRSSGDGSIEARRETLTRATPIEMVAHTIAYDLSGRSGLDHCWDALEDEGQGRLVAAWAKILNGESR